MLPAAPALAPGAVVVRRDAAWLEVRLGLRRVAVLPDRPEVRDVLDALREHRRPALGGPQTRVLDRLLAHDLVVDGLLLGTDAADEIAITARGGLDAGRRLARRREASIAIRAAGGLDDLAEPARDALLRAGLAAAIVPAQADPVATGADPTLLLAHAATAAEEAAPWVAAGLEHLVVLIEPDGCVVGPYVHPGLTACLHCVLAHRTDRDPRWPLTAAQVARLRPAALRPDPALLQEALAIAAADLVRAVEGDVPLTWSSSRPVRMEGTAHPEDDARWLRHPACGCAWDAWPAD